MMAFCKKQQQTTVLLPAKLKFAHRTVHNSCYVVDTLYRFLAAVCTSTCHAY